MTPEEVEAWENLAAEAAEKLIDCAHDFGGEWGPWPEENWLKDADLVNRLRAVAGLPPIAFDKWGKLKS